MKHIIVLSIAVIFGVNGQESCNPSDGGLGKCVLIQNCPDLLQLVTKTNKSPADFETLKKAACGFDGNTPKVCCSTPCFTPNNEKGKCVSVYACPHIEKMLSPPVSNQNLEYVQKSRCQGSDQYSVCCGPPPGQKVQKGKCASRIDAYPPDPRTECCGVDSGAGNKIVGGTATGVDQYPWLALIEYTKDNRIKLLCGGALISGRYVLTAAHCVAGPVLDSGTPKNIRLGEYDTSNNGPDCIPVEGGAEDCTEPVVILPIDQYFPHQDYNPQTKRNDIGMIRMRQMAPYTDFIRPICLPTRDITGSPPPNFKLYAAGWGAINATHSKSTVKLHVALPFVSERECQPSYSVPKRKAALWQGQLCAGGEKGKDSCKGDSGGPLMFENGKIFEVIGIVSFGPTPCGMEDIPGVYTKVYEYLDWISSNIQP